MRSALSHPVSFVTRQTRKAIEATVTLGEAQKYSSFIRLFWRNQLWLNTFRMTHIYLFPKLHKVITFVVSLTFSHSEKQLSELSYFLHYSWVLFHKNQSIFYSLVAWRCYLRARLSRHSPGTISTGTTLSGDRKWHNYPPLAIKHCWLICLDSPHRYIWDKTFQLRAHPSACFTRRTHHTVHSPWALHMSRSEKINVTLTKELVLEGLKYK